MQMQRSIVLTILALSCWLCAAAQQSESDSMQQLLSRTSDPEQRVRLLLNLKDINEASELNLPLSIQLFREAAAVGDTYAMSAAVIPILTRYSGYAEKQDSLLYYIKTLRKMTPNTDEQGMEHYSEMCVAYNRLRSKCTPEESLRQAHDALRWCHDMGKHSEDIYQRTKRLVIQAYAETVIAYHEHHARRAYTLQIDSFKTAYSLTTLMPSPHVRRNFATLIYTLLSIAYNQAHNYPEQLSLTREFTSLLDTYQAYHRERNKRPYFYSDNNYILPYQQLIRCAININRKDLAKYHFNELRHRLLSATGANLRRNQAHIYETGYLTNGVQGDYDRGLHYIDSLIHHISSNQGAVYLTPEQTYQIFHDRSMLLVKSGRYADAYLAYERTAEVQDSLFAAERTQRTTTIARSYEMDRMKLAETRSTIRSRIAINITVVIIGLLVIGAGVYLHIAWRRNRLLQRQIQRHNLKAQESERMKTIFVDTICRGIEPPFNALDNAAQQLMIAGVKAPERHKLQEAIRQNTDLLLSTLDNMLEAANLDSLTDRLQFSAVDIDELCRAELLVASRLRPCTEVNFAIDAPGTRCIVHTHAKYFSFVIRALLDNASKYTTSGSITLRYEMHHTQNELRLSISDTGCGVPPERRADIFRPLCDHTAASRGLSLALCSLIAGHLAGSIRLDESYTDGARFILTIPIKP